MTVYIYYFSYLSFSICKTPPPTTSPFTMSDHPSVVTPVPHSHAIETWLVLPGSVWFYQVLYETWNNVKATRIL